MTTLYSIPSGTADEHTTLAVLRADLLAATNFANTLHDEIVRLRDTITEQRQEIEDLSQFTQLARNAVAYAMTEAQAWHLMARHWNKQEQGVMFIDLTIAEAMDRRWMLYWEPSDTDDMWFIGSLRALWCACEAEAETP